MLNDDAELDVGLHRESKNEPSTQSRSRAPGTPRVSSSQPRIEPLRSTCYPDLHRLMRDAALAEFFFEHPQPTPADLWSAIELAEEVRMTGRGAVFGVFLEEVLIGLCRLDRDGPELATAEVGYGIGAPFRDRGLATAALALVLEHAFTYLGVEHVTARCDSTNLASRRVLEKLGFKRNRDAETTAPLLGFELRCGA